MAAAHVHHSPDALDDHLASLRSRAPGHIPPIRDHNGFELLVHKNIANRQVDHLHHMPVPEQWSKPTTYRTLSEMREGRRADMKPHSSYDIDGDGFVSQADYRMAKRHDLGGEGKLLGGQRKSAIADACHAIGSRLQDQEIGANARARRLMTSLRDEPEVDDVGKLNTRLRVAGTMAQSLKMRSSQQLKDCLVPPVPQPRAPPSIPEEPPRAHTRTMMLERRREEKIAAEAQSERDYMATFGPRSY